MNYWKDSDKARDAWFKYVENHPGIPVSAKDFVAGWNAAKEVNAEPKFLFSGEECEWNGDGVYVGTREHGRRSWKKVDVFEDLEHHLQLGCQVEWLEKEDVVRVG